MAAPPACGGSGNPLSFSGNLSCKASGAHRSYSGPKGWCSRSEVPVAQGRTISSKTYPQFSVMSHYLSS